MSKITIALDLDGVIWDMVLPWIDEYNKRYDDNLNYEDVVDYDLTLFMTKCSREDYCHILTEPEFWQKVEPFEGNTEWLEKLNEKYNVVIATKTDYRTYEIKVERFLELFPFIKYDQIICIGDKSLLDVDILVDDCPANLENGNFQKIIYDAPYNRTIKYFRVWNLKQLYEMLEYIIK